MVSFLKKRSYFLYIKSIGAALLRSDAGYARCDSGRGRGTLRVPPAPCPKSPAPEF